MYYEKTQTANGILLQLSPETLSYGGSVRPPEVLSPGPFANKKAARLFLLVDFVLATLAYLGVSCARQGGRFVPAEMYLDLLPFYYFCILAVSLFFKKYAAAVQANYFKVIFIHAKCALLSLYLTAMLIVFLGWTALSRLQVIGSFSLLLLLESAGFTIYYYTLGKEIPGAWEKPGLRFGKWFDISFFLLFNEFLLITLSFLLINYARNGTFALSARYEKILMVIYGVWLFTAILTRKFDIRNLRNFFYFVAPYFKSYFLMIALMALLIFSFRLFYYSRLQIFGTFFLLLILETFYNSFYFLDRLVYDQQSAVRRRKSLRRLARNGRRNASDEIPTFSAPPNEISSSLQQAINNQRFRCAPECRQFIESQTLLSRLTGDDVQAFDSAGVPSWNGCQAARKLFINTYRVNDIRRINKYFLDLRGKMELGSYFIGRFEALEAYKKRFFEKCPRKMARPLYYINFIFTRVFPKLPYIKNVYFTLTRGKNRVISTTEVLGRLCYCGFRVIDFKEINGNTYYLAQKAGTPSTDKTPSYGPLIKIEKVGLDGKTIYLRKIRTMHPYSEYLQEFIHQRNSLAASGKFKEDFRVAEYGEFFRKYWIDEMPQVINFFRGDISLVGVRALSRHYFSLYPKNVQKLRIKFKPGIVPPYYADLPKSFEEIVASEKRYLEQKLARPFTTDIKYLYRALYNVLFKKARSQ